nr:hypothetical protein [uncultured Desulfobacter sp.]
MKKPFIEHSFSKMIDGKFQPQLAAGMAEAVLKHLDEVKEKIDETHGDEAVENVLSYREVKRALDQIIDYCRNASSTVTDEDHGIYYEYAYNRLKKAEDIIDKELSDLNF